ncbi:hypothetical protein [Simiduia aestuariiviva]|uniref:Uncharacterized protein n=1 Tax=Simiduia aestuariiviva TaxID=1510459 RepID=A0A839UKR9_9GAMM|nr:hypothetical protein [Simiduia aestuariiviva]MBB3167179.1 hypothetical protein [Simiduia aestuariiviva]
MEIVGVALTLLSFAITLVVGVVCFFKGLYFMSRAASNAASETVKRNSFVSFNKTNVLWVRNGLNEQGRMYRKKAFKNIAVFFALLFITALLSALTGFDVGGA